ncbi:hypothetical protein H4Q26_005239 [Puccinia striiformis f. sp. tritici PST-130]|nr:hypothetical protein H4Q26_005239 [Puccinia striiformis f. sp. tritici PST-130]
MPDLIPPLNRIGSVNATLLHESTDQIDRSTLPSKINLLDQPFHPTIQIQPQRYYTQALTESNQPFYSTISIQPKSTLLFYYQIGPV